MEHILRQVQFIDESDVTLEYIVGQKDALASFVLRRLGMYELIVGDSDK
jgi:hypothetical protein